MIIVLRGRIMAVLKDVKRIVVKVGTSTLTYNTGKTNIRRMHKLVSVLSDIVNSGIEVALVTSGAIGVGVGKLGLKEKPADTAGKQAAATIGQCELMFMYDKLFGEYGHTVGQLLITKSDVENDERRQNLVNTFNKLFDFFAKFYRNKKDAEWLIDTVGKKVYGGPLPNKGLDEVVYVDFEGISAPIPADPVPYLKYAYGESYMQQPVLSKRRCPHNFARIDLGKYLFAEEGDVPFRKVNVRGELFECENDV